MQEHHNSHDREKNPAGQYEDVEEVALHDQRALLSLEIRLKVKQVVAGADLARVAEPNAGDDDCKGEIGDKDQGLHRVDERPLRLGDAAGSNRPNRCEGVQYKSGDKNGEELRPNVMRFIQVCVLGDHDWVVDVRLRVAERIFSHVILAALIPEDEVQEVGHEDTANDKLRCRPPKVHPLGPCSFHFD